MEHRGPSDSTSPAVVATDRYAVRPGGAGVGSRVGRARHLPQPGHRLHPPRREIHRPFHGCGPVLRCMRSGRASVGLNPSRSAAAEDADRMIRRRHGCWACDPTRPAPSQARPRGSKAFESILVTSSTPPTNASSPSQVVSILASSTSAGLRSRAHGRDVTPRFVAVASRDVPVHAHDRREGRVRERVRHLAALSESVAAKGVAARPTPAPARRSGWAPARLVAVDPQLTTEILRVRDRWVSRERPNADPHSPADDDPAGVRRFRRWSTGESRVEMVRTLAIVRGARGSWVHLGARSASSARRFAPARGRALSRQLSLSEW